MNLFLAITFTFSINAMASTLPSMPMRRINSIPFYSLQSRLNPFNVFSNGPLSLIKEIDEGIQGLKDSVQIINNGKKFINNKIYINIA